MDKKNYFKRFKYFIYIVLITSFLVIYFASESGYFDDKKSKQVILTNEQIDKFENDIREGKEIDVNDYYIDNNDQYDNKFNKLGVFLSSKIENVISGILDKAFKALNDFLNN